MKVCTKCGIEKSLDEFGNCKTYKDGKQYNCKECFNKKQKKYSRQYREENKDKHKEYMKKYMKTDKRKEYRKEYFKNKTIEYNNKIHLMFNTDKNIVTYIMVSDGFYKIGRTSNLYNRIESLKSYISIGKIYILNKNIEKRLLRDLKEYRFTNNICFDGKTECFNLTDDILKSIIDKENFKEFTI